MKPAGQQTDKEKENLNLIAAIKRREEEAKSDPEFLKDCGMIDIKKEPNESEV